MGIQGCDTWVDQEKAHLQTLQDGIMEKINGLGTTTELSSSQQKYQDLLSDVEVLQETLLLLDEQCNAGGMKLELSNSVETGNNSPSSKRKAVVRVAGVSDFNLAID